MDEKTYKEKDRELEDLYNDYVADCAQHETQIAINHQNMAKIRMNRAELLRRFEDHLQ